MLTTEYNFKRRIFVSTPACYSKQLSGNSYNRTAEQRLYHIAQTSDSETVF